MCVVAWPLIFNLLNTFLEFMNYPLKPPPTQQLEGKKCDFRRLPLVPNHTPPTFALDGCPHSNNMHLLKVIGQVTDLDTSSGLLV